jgi:hypothetical protein
MTDSVNLARVCVLCENRELRVDRVAELYRNQIEFNYLPYSEYRENMVKEGKLIVGSNVYDYVYCDDLRKVKGVPEIQSVDELTYRDLYTKKRTHDLRVSRIVKDGIYMIFMTNEGNEIIDTDAYIEGETSIIAMDLWRGTHVSIPSNAHEGITEFHIKLGVCESSLLILYDNDSVEAELLNEKRFVETKFCMVSHDEQNFVKTYRSNIRVEESDDSALWIRLNAEEMVECYVNGRFVDFSLWGPHEFDITGYVKAGDNEIIINVTGNAANRFTEHRIDYGLL